VVVGKGEAEVHDCAQAVEIARIQERESQIAAALLDNKQFHGEIASSLKDITASMVTVAKQSVLLESLKEGQDRQSRHTEEVFRRLRALEQAPAVDAKQQAQHQRAHMTAMKVTLISCACSILVGVITGLMSRH